MTEDTQFVMVGVIHNLKLVTGNPEAIIEEQQIELFTAAGQLFVVKMAVVDLVTPEYSGRVTVGAIQNLAINVLLGLDVINRQVNLMQIRNASLIAKCQGDVPKSGR